MTTMNTSIYLYNTHLEVCDFDEVTILILGLYGYGHRPVAPQFLLAVENGALFRVQIWLWLKPPARKRRSKADKQHT